MRQEDIYLVLDARAAFGEPEDALVMESGTAEECCEACNNEDYGEGCVVADSSMEIQWHWFHTGRWIVE